MTPRAHVVLYTRAGCHLCDDATDVLDLVGRRVPFELTMVDVDTDAALALAHGNEVPVVFINGRKVFKYRIDPDALERRLRDV